jgi:glutamine amidotransferase
LAYIGNDPQRVRCALHAGRRELQVAPQGADGWGVGFFHSGEVLLQRRPKPPEGPIDFYEVAGSLTTDVLIGHVRTPQNEASPPKSENTPPFRFRSWLFAHLGAVPGFEKLSPQLLSSVPDFLRRNIRGQTPGEHLFHLFLAFLHDANKLDDALIPSREVSRALSEALALLGRLARAAGIEEPKLAAAVSNGRILVGAAAGQPACFYKVSGVRDCPVCRDPSAGFEPERRARPRGADHDHLRGVVLQAGLDGAGAPWEPLPPRSLFAVSHELETHVVPLDAPAA